MNADPYFVSLIVGDGRLADLDPSAGPVRVYGWRGQELALPGGATQFGMVTEGAADVTDAHGTVRLAAGMYCVIPGPCHVRPVVRGSYPRLFSGAPPGRRAVVAPSSTRPVSTGGNVIAVESYPGQRQFGGPVTGEGRLRYIDGCSDALLVCLPRRGEPCLNYLRVPPGTRQSAHMHPSERIGVILAGRGECRTPRGVHPLSPGIAWRIPTGALHAFATDSEPLEILAWHPDSDFGPTDADHPMLNRTIRSG
jgi:quercetin dioxygenase-like cupin family protein